MGAVAFLASCSDSGEPLPPLDCTGSVDTTGAATVSYAADIAPLWATYGCLNSGCHGRPLISSEYSTSSHEDVLTPGEQARSLRICPVVPGDPDASYLVRKLEGGPNIGGERMPDEGDFMTPQDLLKVRTWIAEGARDN